MLLLEVEAQKFEQLGGYNAFSVERSYTMVTTMFLLGRPGSGKSRVARGIARYIQERGYPWENWVVLHLTDYTYLFQMFQQEKQDGPASSGRRFAPGAHQSFEVKDFSVLPQTLKQVNDAILPHLNNPRILVLVEFARNNYQEEIWKIFDQRILNRAYFLCLHAKLGTCISRIHKRVDPPIWPHDTFVSDEIMTSYYQDEQFTYLSENFSRKRLRVVENSGKWQDTWPEIQSFVDEIFTRQIVFPLEYRIMSLSKTRTTFDPPSPEPMR